MHIRLDGDARSRRAKEFANFVRSGLASAPDPLSLVSDFAGAHLREGRQAAPMDRTYPLVPQAETSAARPRYEFEDSGATRRGGLPSPHYIKVLDQRSATRLVGRGLRASARDGDFHRLQASPERASNESRAQFGTAACCNCREATFGRQIRIPMAQLNLEVNEMSVDTMQELLIDELKDLYSAEKQIVRALPKLAKSASTPELQQALLNHLEETKEQVNRLEKIGELVGKRLTGKTCVGMKGVLEEGSEVLEDTDKGTIRDAALIAAAQRVEHYEMAGYGSAREFAKLLGLSEVASLLDETLAEEKAADKTLSGISKQVNAAAKREA
jgi:ferritin-like metal-binding protein YciE